MTTANEINAILSNWLNSPDGKKAIQNEKKQALNGNRKDGTFLSKAEMIRIGEELKTTVCKAIIDAGIKSFDFNSVIVQPPFENITGEYVVKLIFSDDGLKRKSLWNGNSKYNGYTGDGVYDIVGLFSKGYTAKKRVYGLWSNHEGLGVIGNKLSRDANDFITKTVNEFIKKYADKGIKVSYPSQWGGDI